jgi:hypothetical protein
MRDEKQDTVLIVTSSGEKIGGVISMSHQLLSSFERETIDDAIAFYVF